MTRSRQKLRARARWINRFALGLLLAVGFGVFTVVAQNAEKKTAVESPVYVKQDRIRFDHTTHRDTKCGVCHGAATSSARAADDLMPSMQICAECHAETAEPRLNQCSECHLGYSVVSKEPIRTAEEWRAVRPAPMPVSAPAAVIRFPHSKHSAPCTSCHSVESEPTMPSMASCQTCHDGKMAPGTCSTCHPTDAKTGRTRTQWGREPSGIRVLKPDNHNVDWIARHGAISRSSSTECATCHQETDCATCHTEHVQKPWQYHPPNYTTIHALDARAAGMGNCTDCHTVDSFCTSCHVRSNVSTRVGSAPPPRLEFHPPGWLDASMPNNHGVMARRNIVECASCHVENDCVTCHTGINPHPPEFRLDCGRWLSANPRPCTKCHTSLEELRAICR